MNIHAVFEIRKWIKIVILRMTYVSGEWSTEKPSAPTPSLVRFSLWCPIPEHEIERCSHLNLCRFQTIMKLLIAKKKKRRFGSSGRTRDAM